MKIMKKALCLALASTLTLTLFAGCSSKKDDANGTAATKTAGQVKQEPKKVVYWYYHKGDEGAVLDKAVQKFNQSQSEYVVEGLSVPDKQKYIVAMASNESPDLIGTLNQDIISYVGDGLLEDMGPLAQKDGFDMNVFSQQSLNANKMNGKVYGLPWATVIIEMFYNKDILKEIGAQEPPKTMEELYDMAIKATKLDKNGDIDVLGYPLFPLAAVPLEGIYAFGGKWIDDKGNLTPDNSGVLESLEMNLKYRKQFGMEKIQKFVATANTNRYTPQDYFFAGKQLFRFDGAWLAKMIKDNNPKLNYGISLVPGTKSNPGARGASRLETSSVSIPKIAKEKQGAWKLARFLATDGNKDILMGIGSLPSLLSLYKDNELNSREGFQTFIDALKNENAIPFPMIKDFAKYRSMINDSFDTIYSGSKTPKEAMDALKKQTETLKK